MFNVCVEPKVLKKLETEGYKFEFDVNKVIVRNKEGKFSFGIIYKDETYELLIFSQTSFCYATFLTIEFDKIKKCPILNAQMKHKETTVFKTIICYDEAKTE